MGISYQKKLESLEEKKAVHTSWKHGVRRICQLYANVEVELLGVLKKKGEGLKNQGSNYGVWEMTFGWKNREFHIFTKP